MKLDCSFYCLSNLVAILKRTFDFMRAAQGGLISAIKPMFCSGLIL